MSSQKTQWQLVKIPAPPLPADAKVESQQESKELPVSLESALLGLQASGKAGIRSARGLVKRPGKLNTTPANHAVLRFVATTNFGANASITVGNVIGALGVVGTVVNTTTVSVASSFRIHWIRVYPPAQASALGLMQAAVGWAAESGYSKDDSADASMPYGVSIGSCVEFKPPAWSEAKRWHSGSLSSNTLFTLTATAQSVIEISLDWTLKNNLGGVSFTTATAALGSFYYLYLDGNTTHLLQPIDRPTTY